MEDVAANGVSNLLRPTRAANLKVAMDALAAKVRPVDDTQELEDTLDEAMNHIRPVRV